MTIKIIEVKTKRDLRKYIYLPEKIHANDENWVPPIYSDEWNFYNPKKNKSFSYCDTILLLALKNGKVAGRIMGIINHRYNELKNEKHGRFEFLECRDEPSVAHALISQVEDWAKNRGMNHLVGPLGFSDKDPQGFLIEGFDHLAIIATTYNREYMVNLITKEGYIKNVDLLDYIIEVPADIPEIYKRIYKRLSHKADFKIVEFANRKEIKPYIIPVLQLMNETYGEIYGFVPLDEKEMVDLAKRYLPILHPDFIKLVLLEKEVIGFVVGIPDLSTGLKKAKGKLFPFGIFKIFRAMKKSKRLNLLLGAIKPKYQGLGIDVIMGVKMMESAIQRGMTEIESHLILENNHKMNGEVIKAGGKVYKQFRIYKKAL
jgi:hypothetical protein